MRNIKLLIRYDGTDFSGWQRQPDRRTVQQVLEEAIGRLTGVVPPTNASGRTDAGVHALGQVVHFYTVSEHSTNVFVKALNAMLPPDVRVQGAWDMPQSFHSTVDARSKRYRYVIDNHPVADPFRLRYSDYVYQHLDVDAMHRAAQALKGRHDFHSFETNWPNRTSSVRTIFDIAAIRDGDMVHVEVEADGFLYNMVRSITGTLVLVGLGRWPESKVAEALKAEDRREAGPTAPPQGLFLVYVRYAGDPSPELDEDRPYHHSPDPRRGPGKHPAHGRRAPPHLQGRRDPHYRTRRRTRGGPLRPCERARTQGRGDARADPGDPAVDRLPGLSRASTLDPPAQARGRPHPQLEGRHPRPGRRLG